MEAAQLTQQLGNWTQTRGPLHRRLAAAFQQAIEQGLIVPGARVPPERALAEALALSRTTVLTAYNTLRADGWLESRTGSGTWVSQRLASAARHRAHTATVNGASTASLLQIGGEVVDLAMGTLFPLALPSQKSLVNPGLRASIMREQAGLSYMKEVLESNGPVRMS